MKKDSFHMTPVPEMPDWCNRIVFRPVETDAEAVYERLRDRIACSSVAWAGRSPGVSPMWKYVSVAASVAFLAMLSAYIYMYAGKPSLASYVEVMAVAGAQTRVVLPDSTVVCLNGGSRLRYPQAFDRNERSVEFRGEGFFEVEKDRERPFVVRLDGMRVKVLGTVFNIFDDPDSETIETTLLQGKVALFKDTNGTDQADLILEPDQQARFNKRNGHMELQRVETDLYTAWKTGVYRFENLPLQEIASVWQRAFHVKIQIESDRLKALRLTASFKDGETLDTMLSVLRISARYTYRKENGQIYITEE